MNKKKILMILGIVAVVIVLLCFLTQNKGESLQAQLINPDKTLNTSKFQVKVNDYYYAEYKKEEDLNYKFDKYLAVDLNIKNITDQTITAKTLEHFQLEDSRKKLINYTIDENYKKFSKTLQPQDDWDITLIFPVKESDVYYLYVQDSLKKKDEKKYGFTLENNNLKTKKVENTVPHKTVKGDTEGGTTNE